MTFALFLFFDIWLSKNNTFFMFKVKQYIELGIRNNNEFCFINMFCKAVYVYFRIKMNPALPFAGF